MMEQLISVAQTALPVFLALGLGALCRKIGFLSREGVDVLKKVVVNITLPAVLVASFATAEYSLTTLALPVVMFLLCCLALGVGFVWTRLGKNKSHTAPYLATGFEAGMLGYALFTLLFKDHSTAEFAILDIGQTIFVFTLYKLLLSGGGKGKALVMDMVKTPILWAVFAGVLLGATGLYGLMEKSGLSGVFQGCADFVAAPTGMIILLTVGYDLVPKEIPWKSTLKLIAMRFVSMAVVYGVLVLLNRTVFNGVIFEGAALLMCILPPPYVLPVFADEPAERVQTASALSALTVLTMVLFAVCCAVTGLG